MNLTTLNKWMAEYKKQRVAKLTRTQEIKNLVIQAIREQRTQPVNHYTGKGVKIKEIVNTSGYMIAEKYDVKEIYNSYKKMVGIVVYDYLTIEGVEYKKRLYDTIHHSQKFYDEVVVSELSKLNPLSVIMNKENLTKTDLKWLEIDRTETEIDTKAEKEMQLQKQAIEAKVKKICGDKITHVEDLGDTLIIKGSNDRLAKLWAIVAGGWNIQCEHIRVLVKEIK